MTTATVTPEKILNGAIIGVVTGFEDNQPRVTFPDCLDERGTPARTTERIDISDIGREVVLMFENGNPHRPIVIGKMQPPSTTDKSHPKVSVVLDGERLLLQADREIVFKCGKASITLTRAGKILIRGAYLLSRSSGVNRIKGGSVQIN